ncbi:F-box protein At1g30790-like [Apium graveolens]|uniref:F-box protein At1g30790-like n=1 Tax=Apium graveolens TaxID=4045 RepID=UPI003D79AB67
MEVAENSRNKIANVLNAAALLPEEIAVEILSWCEAKSLLRFKCVCKRWYAIIQHRKFAEMRMKNTGTVHYIKSLNESLNIDGIKEIKCLSSCDGFLLEKQSCLASGKPSVKYRVSNPSTRQIIDLPDPHDKVIRMGIYFQSCSYNVVYNVVSVFAEGRDLKFEVVELGNGPSLAWRTLNIKKFYDIRTRLMNMKDDYFTFRMSTDRGMIYFCTIVPAGSSNAEIICVDLEKEVCTTCTVPQSLHSNWNEVIFMMWNDKPSLLAVVKETIYIRVLEDYKKQKWGAANIIVSLPRSKKCPDMKAFKVQVYRIGGKDVLIYADKTIGYEYKIASDTWFEIKTAFEVLTFELQETFVILKG